MIRGLISGTTVFAILFYLLNATEVMASAYWLDVKGSGKLNETVSIRLYYGSMNERGVREPDTGKELKLAGAFRFQIIDPDGLIEKLSMTSQKDCWQGTFVPKKDGRYRILGINEEHPVIDRSASGGENVLPIDYLCAQYATGSTPVGINIPLQLLDMVSEVQNGFVVVRAFCNGRTSMPGTTLRVFNPDEWEKELVIDKNGAVKFFPIRKGTYIIRQDWFESRSGKLNAVKYSRIRHRCNYFLIVK